MVLAHRCKCPLYNPLEPFHVYFSHCLFVQFCIERAPFMIRRHVYLWKGWVSNFLTLPPSNFSPHNTMHNITEGLWPSVASFQKFTRNLQQEDRKASQHKQNFKLNLQASSLNVICKVALHRTQNLQNSRETFIFPQKSITCAPVVP